MEPHESVIGFQKQCFQISLAKDCQLGVHDWGCKMLCYAFQFFFTVSKCLVLTTCLEADIEKKITKWLLVLKLQFNLNGKQTDEEGFLETYLRWTNFSSSHWPVTLIQALRQERAVQKTGAGFGYNYIRIRTTGTMPSACFTIVISELP